MPKLTPEERAALEAQLAEDDEDDDTDSVTIGKSDGSTFTGTFKRALQLGLVTLPAKPDPKAAAKTRNVSPFGQRKTS